MHIFPQPNSKIVLVTSLFVNQYETAIDIPCKEKVTLQLEKPVLFTVTFCRYFKVWRWGGLM